MDVTVAAPDDRRAPIGLLGLVAGTLIKPKATILALTKLKRSWWGIPALAVVASIVMSVVAYSYADCRHIHQLEMDLYLSSDNPTIRPPEPITPLPITMTIRAMGRVVTTGVGWLAWSGALYLILIVLGHSGVSFGGVWTLVLWSWMPHAVRGIMQSAYMTAVHVPIYNQGLSGLVVDNTPPPPMTFTYVIPTKQQLMMGSLLERLDVFLVWQAVLMVAGTTALTRLSRKKAIAVVFGIWLAFALVAMIPDLFPRTFSRFRYF